MFISDDAYKEVKSDLEEAAFLVNSSGKEKEVHKLIMGSLMKLSKHESATPVNDTTEQGKCNEVNKVARRLKLWSRRPTQINTRILTEYLRLHSQQEFVTEQQLRQKFNQNDNFDSNFTQMKIIADRNHGKIFSVDGDKLSIWEPVKELVMNFKQDIGI